MTRTALISNNRDFFVLALDEFESLDQALTAGKLSEEAVMGTLRHVIQHRRRFKVILAGSHTLDEFPKCSKYLINAQTLHLSYLHEAETRRLIKHPMDVMMDDS